jgi:TPP-dependent pyruvate/acetoin dehydrogenase alpha subunit
MVISVWDDGYGISVSNKDQTTKQSISEALKGFQRTENEDGFEILTVKGWDYLALIETYAYASKIARSEHVPVLIHVTELTQPLGHSPQDRTSVINPKRVWLGKRNTIVI